MTTIVAIERVRSVLYLGEGPYLLDAQAGAPDIVRRLGYPTLVLLLANLAALCLCQYLNALRLL
eukprot:scaffold2129_cov318-Prasinococcus_capsulatus_cf.AAC.6